MYYWMDKRGDYRPKVYTVRHILYVSVNFMNSISFISS